MVTPVQSASSVCVSRKIRHPHGSENAPRSQRLVSWNRGQELVHASYWKNAHRQSACTPTHTYPCIRTFAHTHIHTSYVYPCTCTYHIHIHARAHHIHTHVHRYTCARTCVHVPAPTCVCAHACTHLHMYTPMHLSLIHISEPTRRKETSRMPSSA